jgi:hypothetical protein
MKKSWQHFIEKFSTQNNDTFQQGLHNKKYRKQRSRNKSGIDQTKQATKRLLVLLRSMHIHTTKNSRT